MLLRGDNGNKFIQIGGATAGFRANDIVFDREDIKQINQMFELAMQSANDAKRLRAVFETLSLKFSPPPPRQYQCCHRATRVSCVCDYKTDCQQHGDRHVGTHD